MRKIVYGATAALLAGIFAVPADAQQSAQNPPITVTGPKPAKKAPDPNEVVCEKQQDVSSRLVVRRVCMTRAEWAEQRRQDRMEIDRVQTQQPAH